MIAVEEHTGMFTVLVFGVREVRPLDLPSYGTGEKTACLLLWLEVTALQAAWQTLIVIMNQLQALAHQQVLQLQEQLKLVTFLAKDQMKTVLTPSVQNLKLFTSVIQQP